MAYDLKFAQRARLAHADTHIKVKVNENIFVTEL